MSSGGSSSKARPSAQEISLARVAADKDARYREAFVPLEQAAIDELDKVSQSERRALLAGRGNADVEQAAGQITFNGNIVSLTRGINRGFDVAQAKNVSGVDAGTTAQASIDQDRLNVVKTGQNLSRATGNTLINSARSANNRALSKLASENTVGFATGAALGQLATAGVAGHLVARDMAKHGVPKGGVGPYSPYAVPDSDLGFYASAIRRRHTQ